MSAALHIENLALGYDGREGFKTVVDGLSLELAAGQIGCLLGPSGCGKSTLLRAIAGFEHARRGQIRIGNDVVSSPRQHTPPERRHVGLMFQDYALFPHLSAAQNVGFGLRRLPAAEREARVAEMLALVGLADLGHRHPHELSGGQQQRIALARALATRPALLLLDEPFSSLDGASRERLTLEVRDMLRAAQQTALLVTHNADEGARFADFMGAMDAGRLASWHPTDQALAIQPSSGSTASGQP
ncbi:ABC transporter ATP-binding protein [Roseateles asaccharophilus]|uniref:Iron(III) transport system ATP-binding protein n=1 Tax=Roseateles asaccharophilus TaxID=582607 RepID=A0ABU2A570_9BURK|nr:ABC transporter ATP-binding protein [Roseateles asaccharophilus]MDR7331203.1 iron(III) transport system ATP-binding protein [Roseateles asaccharophilus]